MASLGISPRSKASQRLPLMAKYRWSRAWVKATPRLSMVFCRAAWEPAVKSRSVLSMSVKRMEYPMVASFCFWIL